jgi:hypothetical protein
MAENKTKPTQISVAEFIAKVADPARRADAQALTKLMQSATGEKPKMWGPSIVGFGSYHYQYESGREGDMPLISFSPRKTAIAVYNMGGFSGSDALRAKLGAEDKGCLYIKKLAEVDKTALETLIVKSVAAMRKKHGS